MPDVVASLLPRNPVPVSGIGVAVVAVVTVGWFAFQSATTPSILMRGKVNDVRFSPEGDRLVVVRKGAIEIWDVASESIQSEAATNSGQYTGFSSDGTGVVLLREGKTIPWDPADLAIDNRLAYEVDAQGVRWFGMADDGSVAVSIYESNAIAWDPGSGSRIKEFPVDPLGRPALSGDGRVFVETVRKEKGLRFGRLQSDEFQEINLEPIRDAGTINALAINHDGSHLALCLSSKQIILFDLTARNQEPHTVQVKAIPSTATFDRAADFLWLGHESDQISRVNLKSGEIENTEIEDADAISILKLSSDGSRLVAAGDSRKVWVIDTSSLEASVLNPPVTR